MNNDFQGNQQVRKRRYQVFLSNSTFDSIEERVVIIKALLEAECNPVGMNLYPGFHESYRVIDDSDYYLLFINGTSKTNIWTEKEFFHAIAIDKPIAILFHTKSKQQSSGVFNDGEWGSTGFKTAVRERQVILWSNIEDLRKGILKGIADLIQNHPVDNLDEKQIKIKFEQAATPIEVINALEIRAMQRHHTNSGGATKYVYHYTKMSAVSAIMKGSKWYIGSPKSMNDGLELIHIEDAHADNLFFASFSLDDSENIGMWSMYAQPWEDGVILRIPIEKIKAWIKSGCQIYDADKSTKKAGAIINDAKFTFHAVAYTNAESKSAGEPEILTCGGDRNNNFLEISKLPLLKGYIKDNAWAYENEYRIRVETNSKEKHDAVAVEIPKDVLDSFEFITGPRFEHNFMAVLRKEAGPRLKPTVNESLFTGRLKSVYCDFCDYKKGSPHNSK